MNSNIRFDDLVDLSFVNINVNHSCLSRILVDVPSHPVIEAHSDSDKEIASVGIDVRSVVAMHSKEPCVVWMVRWKRA